MWDRLDYFMLTKNFRKSYYLITKRLFIVHFVFTSSPKVLFMELLIIAQLLKSGQ